jgi:hypothetical protein
MPGRLGFLELWPVSHEKEAEPDWHPRVPRFHDAASAAHARFRLNGCHSGT